MENTGNDINSLNDPFLERMFEKIPFERTSTDFSNLLMSQIYASVEPEIEPAKYRRQMLWAYGLIGAGILIITLILFAVWPFLEINLSLNPKRILNLITASLTIFDSISRIGDWIRESSIELSIFFSLFILFIVERLLRKGLSRSTFVL
jgi:glycopeptide antibiotics resistance protein